MTDDPDEVVALMEAGIDRIKRTKPRDDLHRQKIDIVVAALERALADFHSRKPN